MTATREACSPASSSHSSLVGVGQDDLVIANPMSHTVKLVPEYGAAKRIPTAQPPPHRLHIPSPRAGPPCFTSGWLNRSSFLTQIAI